VLTLKMYGTPVAPRCPKCGSSTTKCVESASRISLAWYFRCSICANVWTVEKTLPEVIASQAPADRVA
jgi:hypothetical protein